DIMALARRLPRLSIKVAGGTLGRSTWDWPDNVEYVGQVSPPDARELLANAFCLLFASRWFEMCPLTVLEAMRLRTPVIATQIGGISELVADGERGLLYPPGDITALEANVGRLENEDLRESLVERAYRYVIDVHSPNTHYQELIGIYRHVVSR